MWILFSCSVRIFFPRHDVLIDIQYKTMYGPVITECSSCRVLQDRTHYRTFTENLGLNLDMIALFMPFVDLFLLRFYFDSRRLSVDYRCYHRYSFCSETQWNTASIYRSLEARGPTTEQDTSIHHKTVRRRKRLKMKAVYFDIRYLWYHFMKMCWPIKNKSNGKAIENRCLKFNEMF